MPNHIRPSKEELQEATKLALEEAEKLKDAPPEEEEESVLPESQPQEAPVVQEETPQAAPSEEDREKLKTKLSASARENQKIYAKNRVINQALIAAEEILPPTEEEMQSEYKDWDIMSDIEKSFAKGLIENKKWKEKIKEATQQAERIEKWTESIDSFLDDPQTLISNPDLEGKTEEFKTFANQTEHNNVPMNILTAAFLHEHSAKAEPKKGSMFERGSGGPNDNPQFKKQKLSLQESRILRETNYAKYKEKLTAGEIDNDL